LGYITEGKNQSEGEDFFHTAAAEQQNFQTLIFLSTSQQPITSKNITTKTKKISNNYHQHHKASNINNLITSNTTHSHNHQHKSKPKNPHTHQQIHELRTHNIKKKKEKDEAEERRESFFFNVFSSDPVDW
jgi:hypothetical protein